MNQIRQYYRPRSVDEALKLLDQGAGKAALVGGGTSLAVRLPSRLESLVDISGLGLDKITEEEGEAVIGAGVKISQLMDSPLLSKLYGGVIPAAAKQLASTPLRNMITVGGNIYQVMPWSDLPGVLMAVDARVVIKRANGRTRSVIATEFFARHPRTILASNEMVTEVRIPIPRHAHFGAFHKVAKTNFDYAALSVTTSLQMKQNKVVSCRLVVASMRPLPIRATQAEAVLTGQEPSRQLFLRAAAVAAGSLEPTADFRYSKQMRKYLVKIWLRRCLEEAYLMAPGGDNAD
jgi:aerobic carbon-monoxide dehydrogenase medium subunit